MRELRQKNELAVSEERVEERQRVLAVREAMLHLRLHKWVNKLQRRLASAIGSQVSIGNLRERRVQRV